MELEKRVKTAFGISMKNTRPLSNGASSNYLFEDDEGKEYVLKVHEEDNYQPGIVERTMNRMFQRGLVPLGYRVPREQRTVPEAIKTEATVLRNWKEDGIAAPHVYATDEQSMMILERVLGTDYRSLIRQGRFEQKHLDALMHTLGGIRDSAQATQDIDRIQNDFHLANFMYDEKTGLARPIDPGLLLNRSLGFQTLNAASNLFFAYSLGIGYQFGQGDSQETRETIRRTFIKSLDEKTLREMKRINSPMSPVFLAYAWLVGKKRGDKKHFEWFNTFRKREFKKIQEEINSQLP